MTAQRKQAKSPPEHYVAKEDLFIGHPEAGTMPVAAFRRGDHVHPALVEQQGWEDMVAEPGEAADDGEDAAEPSVYPPASPAVGTPGDAGKE